MSKQLHKNFTDEQVKLLLKSYVDKEIRKTINRKIDPDIEKNIVKELKIEKDLIKAKDVPIKYYNYSYIKDLLEQKYILNNFLKLFQPLSLLPRPLAKSFFSLVKNI